jgi:hypothetical protein
MGLRVVLLSLVCLVVLLLLVLAPIWLRAAFAPKVNSPLARDAEPPEPENVIEGEFRHIDSP